MKLSATSVVFLFVLASQAIAQNEGTAPLVLNLSGGTRALGLGDAFTAGRGAEVLFYNPANIAGTPGSTISLQRLGGASTLGTFSTIGPFTRFALGAGVQFLDYGADPGSFPSRVSDLTQRGSVDESSLAATVALQFPFMNLRMGVATKYVEEHRGSNRGSSIAYDVGVAREVSIVSIGFAVQNMGRDIQIGTQRAELPMRISLGAMIPRIRLGTFFDAGVAAAVSRTRDGTINPAGGAELIYNPVQGWTFVGRVGARRVSEGSSSAESPITVGGTFGLDRLSVDYVFAPFKGLGSAHRIAIRIQ